MGDSGRWENGVWIVEGPGGAYFPPVGPLDAAHVSDSSLEPIDAGEFVDESQTRGRGWMPNFPFRWEIAAYVSLFSVAILMRLFDLGSRAVHHDESLHGVFANNFANGEGYIHNPLMHGPFLFHSTAASFFLFGTSDFTLRLVEALFGALLIFVPLLLRPRLGNVGTLLVALMLAFSPTLLYFSRFARNDIFMAVWTLALVGVVWRYMDEKQTKWLYAAAALMALGFATKETQFIVVALVGLGLLALSWKELGEWVWGQRYMDEFSSSGILVIVLGAMTLPMLGAFSGIFQDTFGITLAAAEGTTGLATGEAEGIGIIVALIITGVLSAISLAIILRWNLKIGLILMAIFWMITFLLFTSIGTNLIGITSGVWQSLGYWVGQQDVRRGSQPWYYYFIIVSVYDFLPCVVAVVAGIFYSMRGLRSYYWTIIPASLAAVALAVTLAVSVSLGGVLFAGVPIVFTLIPLAMAETSEQKFTRFLAFWAAGTFVAYSLAGEKMPWLTVNVTLPLILLAGKALGDAFAGVEWRRPVLNGGWMLYIGVPIFLVVAWRAIFFETHGNGFTDLIELWVLLAIIGFSLFGMWKLINKIGRAPAWTISLTVVVGVMFVLTVRAGWIATYINSDVPNELLIYTQTAPDIPRLANEIKAASELTGEGYAINLIVDGTDGFTWPWLWYLRDYTATSYPEYDKTGKLEDTPESSIVVVNARNASVVRDALGDPSFSEGRRFRHRQWFPEDYRNITAGDFFGTVIDRSRWEGSIDFFVFRKLPSPIGAVDSFVYFRDDIPLSVPE